MKNEISIVGTVSGIVYSHQTNGEKFYVYTVTVNRTSGATDNIPVLVSERIAIKDKRVCVAGRVRSRSVKGEMKFYVVAKSIRSTTKIDTNEVELEGCICNLTHWINWKGMDITRCLLANNGYQTSYVPCVAFNQAAVCISKMNIGERVEIKGRIEEKKLREKSVYEICIYRLNVEPME